MEVDAVCFQHYLSVSARKHMDTEHDRPLSASAHVAQPSTEVMALHNQLHTQLSINIRG